MKNKIIIHNPIVKNKRHLSCKISTTIGVRKFFYSNYFFAEYDKDIDKVHPSILSIPAVANICPIGWLYDAEIIVETLDETFYRNLREIKKAFREMFPGMDWKGSIKCGHIKSNKKINGEKSAILFSGGIDSYFSFISRKDKKPSLITVWGADIKLSNNLLYDQLINNIRDFAVSQKVDSMVIKTNFTNFINPHILYSHYYDKLPSSWYVAIQHGMGLLGLCAPISMSGKIKKIFISSTYSHKFSIPCGSTPLLDNKVRWSNLEVHHDAFEFERIHKVKALADYMEKEDYKIKFRVCLGDQKEYNCNICQKCLRTITEMLVMGLNPNNHGFNVNIDTFSLIKNRIIEGKMITDISRLYFWNAVKENIYLDNVYEMEGSKDFFKWLKEISLEDYFFERNKKGIEIILRKFIKYFYPVFNIIYKILPEEFLYGLYFRFLNRQNSKNK